MTLYGIRQIYDGKARPLSILAQAELSGETEAGLSSKKYLEVTAGIVLTTGRKTLFLSEDLNFVAELFLDGSAIDYEEYFEFTKSMFRETYEVYNAITGDKVDIDINDPALADAKASITQKQERREEQQRHEEEYKRKRAASET
jgi:hypothetical protein